MTDFKILYLNDRAQGSQQWLRYLPARAVVMQQRHIEALPLAEALTADVIVIHYQDFTGWRQQYDFLDATIGLHAIPTVLILPASSQTDPKAIFNLSFADCLNESEPAKTIAERISQIIYQQSFYEQITTSQDDQLDYDSFTREFERAWDIARKFNLPLGLINCKIRSYAQLGELSSIAQLEQTRSDIESLINQVAAEYGEVVAKIEEDTFALILLNADVQKTTQISYEILGITAPVQITTSSGQHHIPVPLCIGGVSNQAEALKDKAEFQQLSLHALDEALAKNTRIYIHLAKPIDRL